MARKFTSSSDKIVSTNNFIVPNEFSISVWARNIDGLATNYPTLIMIDNGTNYSIFIGGSGTTNKLSAYTAGALIVDPTTNSVPSNTWTNIVLTHIGITVIWAMYINGVSQSGLASVSLANQANTFFRVGFGTGQSTANGWAFADAAVWNVSLTATEAAGLAQGARPWQIRRSALQLWYPIDGLQSPEPDLSGGVNNSVITGTASSIGPPFMPFTPRWPQGLEPPTAVTPQIVHPLLSRRVEMLAPVAAALTANPKVSRRFWKGFKQ